MPEFLPSSARGDAAPAPARPPSLFQNSVVSAACSLTSMADSSASMSGNSTSMTVVVTCGTGEGFRASVPGPARLNAVALLGPLPLVRLNWELQANQIQMRYNFTPTE